MNKPLSKRTGSRFIYLYKDKYVPATELERKLGFSKGTLVKRIRLARNKGHDIDISKMVYEPANLEHEAEVDELSANILESTNKNGEDFRHKEWEIAEHLYGIGYHNGPKVGEKVAPATYQCETAFIGSFDLVSNKFDIFRKVES